MPTYYFEDQTFVIEEFDKAKTFSSFLPGLAGRKGIPLWTFYVNRGQAIASFGIKDKNSPIMEFSPANISYRNTELGGFRTFIKLAGSSIYEPFQNKAASDASVKRTMRIGQNELVIEEENRSLGLTIKITYFNIPHDEFAALARHVQISNLKEAPLSLEVLDGLPEILPYGVENAGYKEIGNLLRSWMEVYNLEHNIPFYKLRSSTSDSAEVSEITSGHFYLSFSDDEQLIAPLVDFETVFGYNTSLAFPAEFAAHSLPELQRRPQVTANKVPCGFTSKAAELAGGQSLNIYTLIGHANDINIVNSQTSRLCSAAYFRQKRAEAAELTNRLTDDVRTSTSSPMFDAYSRQSYLDNFLRGGYPVIFGQDGQKKVYHLFSRKHGDLERDYNFFSIAPEYYSQGNGNFRDMNQNRRNDVFFHPEAGAFNVYMFFSLMQADGYNPLQVKGSTFQVPSGRKTELLALLAGLVENGADELAELCLKPFTPGQIVHFIAGREIRLKTEEMDILNQLLGMAEQNIEANFGEGYWIDHWTYNMDLVDSYAQVFPDKMEELLFAPDTCLYFDSPVGIRPRSEKTVLKDGKVRQYGSTFHDQEKIERFGIQMSESRWLRTGNGEGEIYRANLFQKLVSLSLNKFALLDPYGMGIEMEADKPGWNDAMNGLPGLFGSGMAETFELKRMILFILKALSGRQSQTDQADRGLLLPEEMHDFLLNVYGHVKAELGGETTAFECWDHTASARESYRTAIRFGIAGREKNISFGELKDIYELFLKKLEQGIAKAVELGQGIVPTFFRFETESFQPATDEAGRPAISPYGLPKAVVGSFKAAALPAFLEGPVHWLKMAENQEEAARIYRSVRESDLYDQKIGMYKTSVSLEAESPEIGRIHAFTPGWLERESVFLHMSYKYLLELLKTGLTDEFFAEFKHSLIPFLDPEVYGRSTLENSSFIASSVNPDPQVHGRGFVARLSGSTAEFLSMWLWMMAGKQPFRLGGSGELQLCLEPVLPGWLFNERGEVSFRFLGCLDVTYRNDSRADTFGKDGVSVSRLTLKDKEGTTLNIEGGVLAGAVAEDVRSGRYVSLEAVLS